MKNEITTKRPGKRSNNKIFKSDFTAAYKKVRTLRSAVSIRIKRNGICWWNLLPISRNIKNNFEEFFTIEFGIASCIEIVRDCQKREKKTGDEAEAGLPREQCRYL